MHTSLYFLSGSQDWDQKELKTSCEKTPRLATKLPDFFAKMGQKQEWQRPCCRVGY